jgi:hypothetical protein
MVKKTTLDLALISFACAFCVSLGVIVLLQLGGTKFEALAPIFVIGAVVLSYVFYRIGDIKLILVYSLGAVGILFVLFPTFMYLGIPRAVPEQIEITLEQAVAISVATGVAALILAIALLKSPLKGK